MTRKPLHDMSKAKLAALLPVLIMPLAMIALALSPREHSLDFRHLYFAFSIAFSAFTPLFVSAIFARTYLKHGVPGSLFLGCGLAAFGLGGGTSGLGVYLRLADGAGFSIAVFNIATLLASVFFVTSATMVLAGRTSAQNPPERRRPALILAYMATLAVFGFVCLAAYHEALPVFFIPGEGSTPIRDIVLLSAVVLLAISSSTLMLAHLGTGASFPYWFSLSLALLMASLCGLIFVKTFNSPLNWLARTAQYLTGLYLLAAAHAARREAATSGLSILEGFKALFTAENELRRAKEIAEREAARSRAIIENMAEGLIIVDVEETILDVNPAALAIHGYTDLKQVPRGLDDLAKAFEARVMDGAPLPPSRWPLVRALDGETFSGAEIWVRRKDTGKTFAASFSGAPVRDKDGRIVMAVVVVEDVTDRKRMEEALRQREALLASVLDNFPASGIQLFDRDLRFVLSGGEAVKSHGLDLVGKTLRESVDADLATQLEPVYRRVLAGETAWFEDVFLGRCYSTWIVPVRDASGEVAWGLVMSLDITDRVSAEMESRRARQEAEKRNQELLQSQALIATIGQLQHMMFYAKDVQGRMVMANPGLLELLGKREDELLGKTSSDLYSTEVGEEHMANDQRVLDSGAAQYFEEVADTPRGRLVFLSVKSPFRDPEGNIVGLVGVSLDISRQKRLEEELRQAKEEAERRAAEAEEGKNILDAIMEHIPEGVTLTGGPPNFRLRMASRYALKLAGRAEDELLGLTTGDHQAAWEIYLPDGETLPRREDMPLYRASRRGEVVKNMELTMKRADGSVVPLIVTAAPIRDRQGNVIGAINAWRDISEIKITQEELRKARDEAQRANRAKSEFLANMSHEIRTPMNGVLGMTELALMTCSEPEAQGYLQLAKESGKSLLSIINDILDLAKIEAGKIELEKRPMSLREVVESTLRPLAVTASGKGLELTYSVDPAAPDSLLGDAGRLRQVLTNIVGNAVKFTSHGSVRAIVAPAKEPPSSPGRTRLAFEVADTGIGIPRDKIDKIFESFTQAVSSAHPKYGGTGLGLAISRDLVEMMGGSLTADSEEGRGSVFRFTAEFEPDGAPDRSEEQGRPAPAFFASSPMKILLVEDDQINLILAQELLGRRGHDVVVARNGKQALDFLRREAFDLVLMDVRMPVMSGEEATRRVRAGEAGDPSTPIVALTAHALKEDRERLLAVGMDDYLAKPIDVRELDQALERIRSRRDGSQARAPDDGG